MSPTLFRGATSSMSLCCVGLCQRMAAQSSSLSRTLTTLTRWQISSADRGLAGGIQWAGVGASLKHLSTLGQLLRIWSLCGSRRWQQLYHLPGGPHMHKTDTQMQTRHVGFWSRNRLLCVILACLASFSTFEISAPHVAGSSCDTSG